jgi:uncharacterized damage-inducible protein DinB
MPIIEPMLNEMEWESRATIKVLERVPADRFDWTPHPKSMSLGHLAWHVAGIPKRVEELLRAGTFDVGQARPAVTATTTEGLVDAYRTNLANAKAYISGLDDAALRERFVMTRGEKTLMDMPKVSLIRTVLMNHGYHHRGQLAVYLRLLDVPVPAIYGTSADEQI